jgi:hypothetical protein
MCYWVEVTRWKQQEVKSMCFQRSDPWGKLPPFHVSFGLYLAFLENLKPISVSVPWHSRLYVVVAMPLAVGEGLLLLFVFWGWLRLRLPEAVHSWLQEKKSLTGSNILTPFGHSTSLERFLFYDFPSALVSVLTTISWVTEKEKDR